MDFSVFSLNIRGLISSCDDLLQYVNSNCPDVFCICICETWFNSLNYIDLEGYISFHGYRDNRIGGGTTIYLRNDLSEFDTIPAFTFCVLDLEIITIANDNDNLIISAIYRPPKSNIEFFLDSLGNLCDYAYKSNKKLILAGDFNINSMTTSMAVAGLTDLCNLYGLIDPGTDPTYITPTSSSRIDYILSNIEVKYFSVRDVVFSDHRALLCKFSCPEANKSLASGYWSRDISDSKINKFKEILTSYDWLQILSIENIDIQFESFQNAIKIFIDQCFPKKFVHRRNRFRQPWMNNRILRRINIRNRLHSKFLSSRNPVDLLKFKNYRNKLKTDILRLKKTYFNNYFDTINSKDCWKRINTQFKNKSSPSSDLPNKIIRNNQTFTSLSHILEQFSIHLTNGIETIVNNIPPPTERNFEFFLKPEARVSSSIYLFPPTLDEILSQTLKIKDNQSSGPDGIPNFIVKKFGYYFALLLHPLIKNIFSKGIFPKTLKCARIVLIKKPGPSTSCDNYRSISILSVFSKIIESIINIRLCKFLSINNIINKRQFGFISGRSTDQALIKVTDLLYNNFDHKRFTIGLFLISHQGL